jgi:uncharacterized membrane protein
MQAIRPIQRPYHWKRLLRYFLQGLLILAPIAITVWALYTIFTKIDSLLPVNIPGLGFLIILVFVTAVGYLSSFFLIDRLLDVFDHWLERTPGIKFIYSSVKDFFEAFAGDKRKFNKAVLVCIHHDEVWQLGFVTQENLEDFGLAHHVAVYVPQSYAFAGHLYMVLPDRIRLLDNNISAGDAMKFAISGGVAEPGEEDTKEKK